MSSTGSVWRRGLPLEVEFWESYIATGGGDFPEEFRARLDPSEPIGDPLILEAVKHVPAGAVRILDVGAGPLTALGKRDPADQRGESRSSRSTPSPRSTGRSLSGTG